MPAYLLNSTVDLASEVIMHEYESLRRNNSRKSKQYRHAQWLLVPEAALVFFSWFLSWRQLLLVMPLVEGHATGWVAPIVALFVPVALAATGYAQALVVAKEDADGAGEKATGDQVAVKPKASGIRPRATVDDWRQIVAGLNGQRRSLDATGVQRLLEEHGFGPAAATTARRWAREVANER